MTNVVSIGASCEFLISRAARHRRAGRYDEAMVLLTKARTQFGSTEEIELETARIYEEIGCEEEAARSYLRIARREGEHKGEALFSLALSSAQRADFDRAVSYFQMFASCQGKGVSEETAVLFGRQLLEEVEQPVTRSRKKRIKLLEKRAARLMQQGKIAAAKRAILHAIALHPNAQNYTLLACCCLLRNEAEDAVQCALAAHELSPASVQTMCVLADALMMVGKTNESRRMIYLAAMRAKTQDDRLAAAIECAKYGEDALTLRLTNKLLRGTPYHIRAMHLRACALANMGRIKQASRIFGRICGILPSNSVADYYFRKTKDGVQPEEKIGLGMDVPRKEGIERAKLLISRLYGDPKEIDDNKELLSETLMLCTWAMHSPLAGGHTKTVALLILSALEAAEAREVLLDLLTEPQIAQSTKMAILQILTSKEGFKPYLVDMDGRIVHLAAGAVAPNPVSHGDANARAVQRASDLLLKQFPDAPQKMLDLYLEYMSAYGEPKRREDSVLSAALEYTYHVQGNHPVCLKAIAKKYGVSRRFCHVYIRRIIRMGRESRFAEKVKER